MKYGSLVLSACVAMFSSAQPAEGAVNLFLTGHDPDFHATLGRNTVGAIKINQTAIDFVMDAGFNSFVGTAPKFLFVESKSSIPGGHVQGKTGIVASGFRSRASDHGNLDPHWWPWLGNLSASLTTTSLVS